MPIDRPSHRLDRSRLPDEFTPETVRAMDMRTARMLARPGNGVLTPTEQEAFDTALREVLRSSTDRLGRSFGRERRADSLDLDPDLRRSYQRTRRRLEAQAERARQAFPQLTDGWELDRLDDPAAEAEAEISTTDGPAADGDTGTDEADSGTDEADSGTDGGDTTGDDVSIGTFEAELAQTSDMMDILEQIAGIQQQQLEHQRSQLLGETRQVFFALAVSVAVIVAGVAPLVDASPDERRLILLWTAAVLVLAGGVYAVVRAVQSRSD